MKMNSYNEIADLRSPGICSDLLAVFYIRKAAVLSSMLLDEPYPPDNASTNLDMYYVQFNATVLMCAIDR